MALLETLKPHIQLDDLWKKKAWTALEKMGLPTKKWDAFKYVSLRALSESSFTPVVETFPKEEGAISLTLKEAMRSYGALLQKSFAENLALETNPFALLNGALSEEGQFLYIPPGKKIELVWDYTLSEGLRAPKVEVFVGKGASLTITSKCIGRGTYFFNPYLQLTLDEGARVNVNEHLEHSAEAFAMHTVRARLKRDANLKFFTFSKGARSERHDLQVTLSGENGEVDLKGLSLPSGKDEIHHFITVKHEVENTRSSQLYKTALMDQGRSSFEGKIFVEKEAQKTEAYQLNNNLLLSSKAKAMSKPNLEIYADDVKASHGATVSQPKKEELFYLQTRGLTIKEARWQLARGFCKELLDGETVDRYLKLRGNNEDV
ncbi:MAG: Fe-S cluster assembly protein SufD [Simkaniaceae bacterium]|jgi:Fe-S cluster assembly protein SufD|nr:MAG: Fe-S cluster assembly protein SufD [Simkaniaceae bacterium]